MAIRKLFFNAVSVVFKSRRFRASRRLLAVLVFVSLVVVVLALAGVIAPGRNGNGQPSSEGPVATTPGSGNTSYESHDVVPTNRWMNFYGLDSTLDGQPLPVGAVITVSDSQGVMCGEFLVAQAGRYGLMPVYADDPSTEVDEGAGPGDILEFYINGVKAGVTGPEKPVWTEMGDLKQVNLSASASH